MISLMTYFVPLRGIQKVCHRPKGEGVKQNSDKVWQGGGESSQRVMSLPQKYIVLDIAFGLTNES